MSRIAWNNLLSSSLLSTNLNSQKIFDLQKQLSSGKKIERASDDPDIASKSARIASKIRRDEQTIRNIDNFGRAIAESETFMATSIEQLQRVRTLALQSANETLITADMQAIGVEINQQLESLFATANARSGGRSIFGGAKTDVAAFTATRNAAGEITGVTYQGDDTELVVDINGETPLSWPGDRVFSAGKQIRESTVTTWDGSNSSEYADREIAAAFQPSSGRNEGSLRINGVLVGYDLDGTTANPEGDSLLDIAQKINDASAGVAARVTGTLESNTALALPLSSFSALGGFSAGTISVNDKSVTVSGTDTLFTLANKINSLGAGVTADVHDANGRRIDGTPDLASAVSPLRLRLSGGVAISDNASGNSNIMGILGITSNPPNASGQNLVGRVLDPYAIELTGDRPGPFTIEDASGSLAADLGLTSTAAITAGGSIFQTLIDMRDRLRAGDSRSVRTNLIPELDLGLESLGVYRSEAGIRTERLDVQRDRLESVLLNQRTLLSNIEDADLSEVIIELRSQQAAQTAGLKAVSDLLRLSLLDFLG